MSVLFISLACQSSIGEGTAVHSIGHLCTFRHWVIGCSTVLLPCVLPSGICSSVFSLFPHCLTVHRPLSLFSFAPCELICSVLLSNLPRDWACRSSFFSGPCSWVCYFISSCNNPCSCACSFVILTAPAVGYALFFFCFLTHRMAFSRGQAPLSADIFLCPRQALLEHRICPPLHLLCYSDGSLCFDPSCSLSLFQFSVMSDSKLLSLSFCS